jgi:nicotinic acid mononucleotide adenylyltransferase
MKTYFRASPNTLQRFKQLQVLLNQLQPDAPAQAVITPGSPEPPGNIIVFPGSFNPPTMAHLAMLEEAQQFAQQNVSSEEGEMLLYAALSKHIVDKERVERPLLLDRIVLLETLLQHRLPRTGIMLFNCGLYVEQAEGVRASFPGVKKLYFLLGFDKIVQVLDPRYYVDRDDALRQLFALAELLVAPRGQDGPDALNELLAQPHNQPFSRYIHVLPLDTTYRDISSSRIRQHSSDNEYSNDIPPEVRQFMQETHAYAPPLRLEDGTLVDYYEERVKAMQALLRDTNP